VLRFPLIHPQLLAALAPCGHGGKILIADANYSHSTNTGPGAALIYLNLRPGLLTVERVPAPVLDAVPVEAAHVMRPGDGSGADAEPSVFATYRTCSDPGCCCSPGSLRLLRHLMGREPDLAVCVATGDDRLCANILLTVGYITPSS